MLPAPPPHVRAYMRASSMPRAIPTSTGTTSAPANAAMRQALVAPSHMLRATARVTSCPLCDTPSATTPLSEKNYCERTGKLGHLGAPLSCGDTRDGIFKVAQSPKGCAMESHAAYAAARAHSSAARSGRARLRARRPAPTRTRARLPRGCRQARFRLLQPCRLLSANDAAADANARATSGFAG